jgi:hypothetical protein
MQKIIMRSSVEMPATRAAGTVSISGKFDSTGIQETIAYTMPHQAKVFSRTCIRASEFFALVIL